MADSQTKLKTLLRELFQLDSADLDFGIYRIMNSKRSEIERFLDNDLLPQIKEAFLQYKSSDSAHIKAELDKVIQQLKDAGVDPELSPKVKEFREKLSTAIDVSALENQVFSDLFNFFRRYYNEGDFLSLRRYKEGVYAIPYEGEEVKLYWANHDQYYIKSSEYLRDYTFRLADGRRVHFRLAAADIDKDNNKSTNGNDRRFILAGEDAITEENSELVIRFELRPDVEKRRQEALNAQAMKTILEAHAASAWLFALAALNPSEADPNRTVLVKHLKDYTARNTFDYFIHKDVGSFLRRELDFFIKNEVMHLDDIESATAVRVEQYLSGIKVLRRIACKVIDFVAQLEDFQKRLWLKKKFIVATNYCLTLDRVPEALYEEIAANDLQREEWVRLFKIDEIAKDLHSPGYSMPLSIEFLRCNSQLVLDTACFDDSFKDRLLAANPNLDDSLDGLLVHSDNFHGLNLLQSHLSGRVDSIYIDPPYNTNASEILYKNDYKHSSWLTLIQDRLDLAKVVLSKRGIICVTIDDFEVHYLWPVLVGTFGVENHLGTIIIRNNPQGRSTLKGVRVNHEYAFFFGAGRAVRSVGRLERSEEKAARWDETDEEGLQFLWENFRKTGTDSRRADRPKQFYPVYWNGTCIRVPDMEWSDAKDEWLVVEQPVAGENVFWPRDDSNEERVWKWGQDRVREKPDYLKVAGENGQEQVYCRNYLNTEGRLPGTWWDDARYAAGSHGTNLLTSMFGGGRAFDFPKSVYAVEDCLKVANAGEKALVLDFFGGSGTTAHAVINLNRDNHGGRRYVLIEAGEHFQTALKPRILKAIYAAEWEEGRPASRNTGVSHSLKYIRLESYEDTLNNLEMRRTDAQASLLEANAGVREDYVLRYMLGAESKDSPSLLNIDRFTAPFDYRLNIATGTVGESKPTKVDLVETFNYLLGLRVRHVDVIRGFRVVHGTNRDGEKVLVIWRNVEEKPNAKLDEFFQKQGYNTKDMEFDLIYVNGDNNLENLKKDEDTWKVRLIEEEFARLMFDVQDA
jgi:adenine-specific DNA-methyltransferase